MKISEGSWHYRVFLGWEGRKLRTDHAYHRRSDTRYISPRLDLCTYMRTVFIYAPWRWFWQGTYSRRLGVDVMPWIVLVLVAALGAFSGVAYVWPGEVLRIVLTLLAMVAIACLAGFLVGWALGAKNVHMHVWHGLQAADQRLGDSFVVQYAKAKKKRICPLIEVEKTHD